MKRIIIALFIILNAVYLYSAELSLVKNDNGNAQGTYQSRNGWEESVFLRPSGPCTVKYVLIYYAGSQAGKDTVYFVGDPSEGTISPSFYVHDYNMKIDPIILDYNGTPGWDTIAVSGLRSDGLDRICVQHRLGANGPYFAVDNDGLSLPYRSYILNAPANNGQGQYYLANSDYMVRLLVEYDFPENGGSAPAPAAVMTDVTKSAGLTNSAGNPIGTAEVTVADWNGDGWDDVAIGGNFFQNNKNGTFTNVTAQLKISAGATSWGDFNNDGYLDCFALIGGAYDENSRTSNTQNKVYKNNGDGTFTQMITKDLFKQPYPNPLADFYLSGTPQDSIINPYPCVTPLWLDYNGDGKLDLFFANNRVAVTEGERYFPDQLWMQDSDGKFKLVTKDSKISMGETYDPNTGAQGYYDCYGANACDYNQDNKPDIFVANYRLKKDNLFRNKGDGTFEELGAQSGVQGVLTPSGEAGYFGHGMGAEWGDYNNDGLPDLAVGNLGHPDWRGSVSNPSLLFKNNGAANNWTFTDVHKQAGIKFFEMNAGMTWADFDLDGYQDLWHGQISYNAEGSGNAGQEEPKRAGHYYMNQGPPEYKMKDMTWQINALVHGPWSAARIDYDNDGDLDLLVASTFEGVKLFRNDMIRKGNWLEFRLTGKPAENVCQDAYGTKVIIYSGTQVLYRELMGSMSGTRCTESTSMLHFGLGQITQPDSIVVKYNNGKSNKITVPAVNARYTIPYMGVPVAGIMSTPTQVYPINLQTKVTVSEKMSWTAVNGATNYRVRISEKADMSILVKDTTTISTDLSTSGLSDHKYYYWSLKAMNSKDTTMTSAIWGFNMGLPLPSSPLLSAPAKDTLNISCRPQFSWTAAVYQSPVRTKTGYQIQIGSDQGFQTGIVADSTSIIDTKYSIINKLTPSGKYYWRVRAMNEDQAGGWSEVRAFTVIALPVQPNLTDPPDNAKDVNSRPTLSWEKIALAKTYAVQIATDLAFSNIFSENQNTTSNTYKPLKTMKASTQYYWRVRADNEAGSSEWSATRSFTIAPVDAEDNIINETGLSANPNPANSTVTFAFSLAAEYKLRLSICDESGRETALIGNILCHLGKNAVDWDCSKLTSGVYFCKIETGRSSRSIKFIVRK